MSFLSDEKIRYLNSQIQKSHKTRIERFKDTNKKYSYLAMFLYFKKKELMDMVIEVTSNHIYTIQKRSKKKYQEHNAKNQSIYKSDRERFKLVVKDLLSISDFNEFVDYQNTVLLTIDKELNAHMDDLDEVDFLLKSYPSIDYINDLLEVIEFDSNTKPELVDFLKNYRNRNTRKNNKIDISFFEPKWQKTIYADYNAHYGNGGGIYRYVSDQYTPYYVQMLEGQDSNHVLDELLYHDTSLEIQNHSTDTAGYIEQMFALTYLILNLE